MSKSPPKLMEYPTFLHPRLHHDDRHDEFFDVVVERVKRDSNSAGDPGSAGAPLSPFAHASARGGEA